MSTIIKTVNIGGIDDKRVAMANCGIARVLNIGTSWNTIRLGIRLCTDDLGGNQQQFGFYLGLLASPSANLANGPLSDTTSHFVGMGNSGSTTRRVDGNPFFTLPTKFLKKVNATTTDTSGNVTTAISMAPTVARSVLIMELTKGSPNFSGIILVQNTTTTFPVDISDTVLKAAMEQTTMANAQAFLNGTYGVWATVASAAAFAVNEAVNGFLNSICFAVLRDKPTFYVSDFVWRKMA